MPKIFCKSCGEPNNDIDAACRKCKTPLVKEKKTAAEEKKPKTKLWEIVVVIILFVLTAYIVRSVYQSDMERHYGNAGTANAAANAE